MTELIDQLGGPERLKLTVENFYDKIVSDPMLESFFEKPDVSHIRAQQKMFFAMVLGGPEAYRGRDLRKAHAGLVDDGMSDPHFSRMKSLFRQTLVEMDVEGEAVEKIVDIFEARRNEVLGR